MHPQRTVAVLTAGMIALALAVMPAVGVACWTSANIKTAIAVADAYWPESPCKGREQLQFVQTVSATDLGDTAATSWPDQCLTDVSWPAVLGVTDYPGFLCSVLEHEFGHLAGYYNPVGVMVENGTIDHTHSPNPNSVMFPVIGLAPNCHAAFPFPHYGGRRARRARRAKTPLRRAVVGARA